MAVGRFVPARLVGRLVSLASGPPGLPGGVGDAAVTRDRRCYLDAATSSLPRRANSASSRVSIPEDRGPAAEAFR